MSRLGVVPIVEGHGEVQAIRTLLWRTWTELLGAEYVEVLQPVRQPRSKLVKESELQRAVKLGLLKLGSSASTTDRKMVLVLIDADEDGPCVLGPKLLDWARQVHPDADVACVLANVEYETWFVAAAESLRGLLDLPSDERIPEDPEALRLGKAWIERRFRGTKYSETVDQPRLTAQMDLSRCRSRSPSFDKLCRELKKRLVPTGV